MFVIDELIEAVKAIPPVKSTTPALFAGQCYLVSEDRLTVTNDQLVKIVDNFPNGCADGRAAFLDKVGAKRTIVTVTFPLVDIYYSTNSAWVERKATDDVFAGIHKAIIGNPVWTQDTANTSRTDKPVLRAKNVTFNKEKLLAITKEQSCTFPIQSVLKETGDDDRTWVVLRVAYGGGGFVNIRIQVGTSDVR